METNTAAIKKKLINANFFFIQGKGNTTKSQIRLTLTFFKVKRIFISNPKVKKKGSDWEQAKIQ